MYCPAGSIPVPSPLGKNMVNNISITWKVVTTLNSPPPLDQDTILFKIDGVLSTGHKNTLVETFSIIREENDYYAFSSDDVIKDISMLYNFSNENNLTISDFKVKETSLEEVFIHLIKKDSISMGD